MADAVKLFLKENSYIVARNYYIFLLSPAIALFLVLWVWRLLPLKELSLVYCFSVILLLLIISIGVYSLLLAGWASNSKYSIVGALRGVAQTISYEVRLALVLMSILLVYKRVNFFSLTRGIERGLALVLLAPVAGVWVVTCLAETNRTPFDFAEGESELVSGFNTEYGAGGFALIFMAEYAIIMFLRRLSTVVLFNLRPRTAGFRGVATGMMFFWIWARATYPRYRYDKLILLAWKKYLPFRLHWGILMIWCLVVFLWELRLSKPVAFKFTNNPWLALVMATWLQFGLQDALSPVIEEFIFFHDFTIIILVFIIRFVGLMILTALTNKNLHTQLLEGQVLEWVWTIVPAVILLQIAVPSLLLLYILDESISCCLRLKVVGHQWYWRYEYSDFWKESTQKRIEFDSYIVPAEEAPQAGIRLLDVDNRVVLPYGTHTRVLIRAADVLHSWTVPALGVKADATPGRLNQVKFVAYRPGIFYGQCSEICGANHSFMPIVLELVRPADFLKWVCSISD